jgi:hypothetical protein
VAKAFMEELPPGVADELAEAYRALPSTADDTRRYAQRVLDPPPLDTDRARLQLPPVVAPARTLGLVRSDQAAKVRAVTGVDVQRFDFSIDPNGIGHVRKEHGNPRIEARRGQRAITADDYALLPQLLSEADRIEDGGTAWRTGHQLVRVTWDRGEGEEWVAMFEVRRGKKSLALESLFVRKRQGK